MNFSHALTIIICFYFLLSVAGASTIKDKFNFCDKITDKRADFECKLRKNVELNKYINLVNCDHEESTRTSDEYISFYKNITGATIHELKNRKHNNRTEYTVPIAMMKRTTYQIDGFGYDCKFSKVTTLLTTTWYGERYASLESIQMIKPSNKQCWDLV